ncbi:cytochrome P450 [Crepidotus variabilis]|uniref:Cytochrome P450 n=1 Tax=Crepidotus variabilis TaxID=179855 RepID=A0A9P6JUI7_9AGAR|nr:cytochrome P450 [Crepidotus variabilis]
MISLNLLISTFSFYALLRLSHLLFKRFLACSPLDNIPGPRGNLLLQGSVSEIFGFKSWGFHRKLAQRYGSVAKINGLLGDKLLYVFDPLAMHHILLKVRFLQSYSYQSINPSRLILNGLQLGDGHKKQRKMLAPIFSAAHMRNMGRFSHICVSILENAFAEKVKNGPQEIDVLSWSGRTALELIAQSGLGSSFDSFTEGAVPHPFVNAAKRIVIVLGKTVMFRIYVLPYVLKIGTPKFWRAILERLPSETFQEALQISDLMHDTSVKIYQSKKDALAQGDGAFKDHIAQGNDLISILMKNNLSASKDKRLSESQVIAQMSTFTFAATDTTSTAISRTLWLLSQQQDVQNTLQAELCDAMLLSGKDTLSYDDLAGLKSPDAVCRDLLRLYPPVPALVRIALQDTVLPLQSPATGLDGQPMHEVLVPKGTNIIISVFNCNRNPAIWGQDADEFKPNRWNDLPEFVTDARIPGVYSNLMTFGGGARSCIGFNFSQLEMKVILSLLLQRFRFTLPPDKEIYWNMMGIVSPCVIGDTDSSPPRLPLIVEEIDRD